MVTQSMNGDTFARQMDKRIRRLDQEFEQLVGKAESVERSARERLSRIRGEFSRKRKKLERKLGEARTAGEGARKELSVGVETAWNDLSDAFNQARAEFQTRR